MPQTTEPPLRYAARTTLSAHKITGTDKVCLSLEDNNGHTNNHVTMTVDEWRHVFKETGVTQ